VLGGVGSASYMSFSSAFASAAAPHVEHSSSSTGARSLHAAQANARSCSALALMAAASSGVLIIASRPLDVAMRARFFRWPPGAARFRRRVQGRSGPALSPGKSDRGFPGGFVDWGEPVEDAAVRETWEETGLRVDLGGLLGVYSYPGTPIVIVVYRARVVEGEVRTCSENDRVEWVVPAEIPWENLAFPSTQAALRDFLSGRVL
jgi:ADP-ribose pyrophosphatase YjhB (NUDIX family)